MQKPEFYAAVYGIIKDENGKILFGKRKNTGYMDGYYELPAGHIEGYETYFEALQREMKEEVGIDILESDVKQVHICHRISKGERVYFDIYYDISKYSGKLLNGEEEKCEGLYFLDYKENQDKDFVEHTIEAIESIGKEILTSERIT